MERHVLKSHSSPRALQLHLCHKAGNCTERVSSRTLSYSTDQWGQPCTNATPSYYHSFKTAFTYDSGNMPAFLFFFMYALAIFGLFKISCELFGRTSQFLQKKKILLRIWLGLHHLYTGGWRTTNNITTLGIPICKHGNIPPYIQKHDKVLSFPSH